MNAKKSISDTHSVAIGYAMWILGFIGLHRFYYGKPVTGVIYFFTLGLLFIGWILDLFKIPTLCEEANKEFKSAKVNYNIAWILLIFTGFIGLHRFYMQKWVTAIIYLFTAGIFGIGLIYDYLTLNSQIQELK